MKKVLTILVLGLAVLSFSGCERDDGFSKNFGNRVDFSKPLTEEQIHSHCTSLNYSKEGIEKCKRDQRHFNSVNFNSSRE